MVFGSSKPFLENGGSHPIGSHLGPLGLCIWKGSNFTFSHYLHLGSQNDHIPRESFIVLKTCIEQISNFGTSPLYRGTSLPNCTCSAMFEANMVLQSGEVPKFEICSIQVFRTINDSRGMWSFWLPKCK